MNTRKTWAILLATGLAMGVAAFGLGTAVGQENDEMPGQENDEMPGPVNDEEMPEQPEVVPEAEEVAFEDAQTCAEVEDDPLNRVSSYDIEAEESTETSQEVSSDEDDVLLAIALANHGAEDISFENLRDVEMTTTQTSTLTQDTDLEREDVFSALALGLTSDVGNLETLDCVSSFDREITEEHEVSRSVSLDEDDVLLSIALANSVDDTPEFDLVASIDEEESRTLDTSQDVDIDRDDTFNALALGAGGNGNNGG